jgi:hypothetical protein
VDVGFFLFGVVVGSLAYAFASARRANKYEAAPQPPAPPSIVMPEGTPDAIARAVANAPALFEQARRAEAVKQQWAATRCGSASEDGRGPCLLDRGHGGDCMDHKGPFGGAHV